ncbi:hypothetical protein [Comamonas sp.]|uniref:hypothetical protein n=1 Tax=Comamonas sp. TaxID=34028 RepID=UPI00289B3AA4|nr:hypothetical protein [Comamonas sp.]
MDAYERQQKMRNTGGSMYQQQSPSSLLQAAAWARKAWQGLQMLGLWLALLCALQPALAQTPVTGVITSNTTLRAAQSPYLFQGDVIVDNNATLSIEPGVTIQMAAAASFTLKRGALQAVGTPSLPIKITSASATPAAGDWRQWRFTAGTNQALTQLGHVVIEYGSGVAIESASPVINNTAINHHSGPAISMDLASSPVGTGNTANGNSLNAIAVPAGTIRTQVVWGIVGIPYLVQQGLVHIGQAPLALEPAKLKLSPGVVAMLRVSLNAPAPAGGTLIDVSSSVPSVASAVTRVTVPEGQTSADFEVRASSLGTTKITASHATLGMAETFIEVANLPPLGLVPINATVGVNQNLTMTLSLPTPATSNVEVQLDNADVSVISAPRDLLIPSGHSSKTFEVMGLADGIGSLRAHADGYRSAWSTINVRTRSLVLPSSLLVAPGATTTVILETTEPAPEGGLNVSLGLAQTDIAQIPATVFIPSGERQGSFSLQGLSTGLTTLTATASGYLTTQTALQVDAIRLETTPLGDFVMDVNMSRTVRVHIDNFAPKGGIVVKVASRDEAVAVVNPQELFIPEGQMLATVPITVSAAAAQGKTAIDITSSGLATKSLNVHIQGAAALRVGRVGGSKAIVGKGLYSYAWDEIYVERLINGVANNSTEPLTVNMRCADQSLCETPQTVTIPAGQSTVYFSVTGIELGSTYLEATADGTSAAEPFPVDVITPSLDIVNLDSERTTSSDKDEFFVRITVPGARNMFYQFPKIPLVVNLKITDQVPSEIISGIYDAAGNPVQKIIIPTGWFISEPAYVAQPIAVGTYQVSAEITGLVSTKSWVQRITGGPNRLELITVDDSKPVVGKNLTTHPAELSVLRFVEGEIDNGSDDLIVNLRCADERICSVPSTVTIPAGDHAASFSLTGVDLGSTQIIATAAGLDTSILSVETVSAVLRLHNAPASVDVGRVHESMYVSAQVPGGTRGFLQTPSDRISIDFSSSETSVGTTTETVTWFRGVGISRSPTFTAISPGTTQITASSPGFVPATSGVITVNP